MTRRLERLLKIRRAGETRERGRWAQARQVHDELAGDAGSASARLEDAAEDVRAMATGELNLARLRLADHGRDALRLAAEKSEGVARAAERQVEERRGALERAHRDVRVIEKFSERVANESRARVVSAERREADDRPRAERP